LGSDESGHEREQSERHATDYEFAIEVERRAALSVFMSI
jgi:hypothetical protein